ncbi:MAG: DUF1559 domain-containing protein [Planctomycetaceae bacterium]|nr:DUF1559 domain-containing protein [Planctomycetaceae bacterium]
MPNAPSCSFSNSDGNNTYGIFAPSSNHSGGVNAALADGSVRFISETISNKTPVLQHRWTAIREQVSSEFGGLMVPSTAVNPQVPFKSVSLCSFQKFCCPKRQQATNFKNCCKIILIMF